MTSANSTLLNSVNASPDSHAIDFLQKTKEKLNEFFDAPKKFLKKLQYLNLKRSKRKERVESITKVSQFLINYVELWTLKIGLFNGGDFVSLCDIKYIAKETGLNYIRVRRALKDLVKAGYLLVKKQVVKNKDGAYRGIASIKQFSTAFFTDLKQSYEKLVQVRDWKRKRIEKKALKEDKKKGAPFLGGLLNPLLNRNKKKIQGTPKHIADAAVEKNRAYVAQVIQMHKEQPDLPLDVIKARLKPLLE